MSLGLGTQYDMLFCVGELPGKHHILMWDTLTWGDPMEDQKLRFGG
jgi:hypothetical protein